MMNNHKKQCDLPDRLMSRPVTGSALYDCFVDYAVFGFSLQLSISHLILSLHLLLLQKDSLSPGLGGRGPQAAGL